MFANPKTAAEGIWVDLTCFEEESGSKQWNFNNPDCDMSCEEHMKTRVVIAMQGCTHRFTIDRRNDAFAGMGSGGRLVIWTQSLCSLFYVLIFIIALWHQTGLPINSHFSD